jgi:hypothetical protein
MGERELRTGFGQENLKVTSHLAELTLSKSKVTPSQARCGPEGG